MNQQMTGKERMQAIFNQELPDCVPVDPSMQFVSAKVSGDKISEFFLNSEVSTKATITAQEEFGFDIVRIGIVSAQYPDLFGGTAIYQETGPPIIKDHLIKKPEDLDKLVPVSFNECKPFKATIDSIEMLSEKIGDNVAIAGVITLPANIVTNIRGLGQLCRDLITNPDFVHRMMEKMTNLQIQLAKAYIDAGVHFFWCPDAVPMPPNFSPTNYEEFVVRYDARIFTYIKSHGLHIAYHPCGDGYPVLCQVRKVPNIDAYNFSEMVDLGILRRIYGGKVILWGNVAPVGTMLQGTPEKVEDEVKYAIEKAGKRGGLVMSLGCAMPLNTPFENISTLVNATRKYGKYEGPAF